MKQKFKRGDLVHLLDDVLSTGSKAKLDTFIRAFRKQMT